MSAEKFTNARVHEWLARDLEEAANTMRTTRVQLNSAALWWFCKQLTLEQRAEILGEYVKVQAMVGSDAQTPETSAETEKTSNKKERRGRRRKNADAD